jgi:A118 family predicted phage portal protein
VNIKLIIDLLNREKEYNLSPEYYSQVDIWRDWWRGFYKPFHEFRELAGEKFKTRKLYTLKMAKKVCEDWASILLNEKTEITVDDNASSEFLQGKDGTGGVFGETDFWQLGNALVEKAFYSGTGAFVVKLDGMILQGKNIIKSPDAQLRIDYLTAHNIIPLTIRNGRVIEAAFASEVLERGKKFIYLETHELTEKGYRISNRYFSNDNNFLKEQTLPAGVLPELYTGTDIPLFTVFSPNIVNTLPNSKGLGISIYAHAIDNLMGVDLAFNNFCRDFKLGGKKVFYSESLVRTDVDGNKITPDDVMQQLFSVVEAPLREDGKNNLMTEYNPDLRVTDNKDGLQAHLDYLSFKVGFGTKHYQFNAGQIVTATQYTGDKQELIQNAAKHYIVVERALKQLVRAIIWAGKEILGQPVNPDATITINFEDSYIIDKESERLRDLQEIRDGLMQKWEYRVKWYGEDEATAKKMVGIELPDDDLMGFTGTETGSGNTSEGRAGVTEVQGKSLNGAQTQSLIAIMAQYSAKQITEGQAINLISTAIGISKEEATKLLRGDL